MIAALSLAGFAGIEQAVVELDPTGHTTITGHSQAGKSTLIEAACYALWETGTDGKSLDTSAVRDGAEELEVGLRTAKGATIWRRMRSRGGHTRSLQASDAVEPAPVQTADQMAAKLGAVGLQADIGRLILAPLGWVPLLQAELGRPLRDLLSQLMPAGELRAVVEEMMEAAGQPMLPTDPHTTDAALKLQTQRNDEKNRAAGRLQAMQSAAAQAETAGPTNEEIENAQSFITIEEQWAAYDRTTAAAADAVARFDAAKRARAEAMRALDAWQQRKGALPAAPAPDLNQQTAVQEMRAARVELEQARTMAADTERLAVQSQAKLASAEAAHQALADAGDGCPTCQRDGWAGAKAKLESSEAALKLQRGSVNAMVDRAMAAEAALQAAQRRAEKAEAAAAGFQDMEQANAAYRAAVAALGPEPTVPAEPKAPAKLPASPDFERPTSEEYRHARSVLDAAAAARGAADRQARVAAELQQAEQALEAATAEAARVVVLVDASRRAPSELARKQADVFGDAGPASLRFPPKENRNTREMEVLVDGRPWRRASRGRLIYADAVLRCAIRRAAAAKFGPAFGRLPVFVDDVQSWTGEWDGIEAPAVYLVTQADVELSSSVGA